MSAKEDFLDNLPGRYGSSMFDPISEELTRAALAAIEAEAVRAALVALRERVVNTEWAGWVATVDVFALIDEALAAHDTEAQSDE